MKLYISNNLEKVKSCFINLSKFYILDVQTLLQELGLDVTDKCNAFFVSRHIQDTIKNHAKSKRLEGIIYVNKNLNEKLFDSLFKTVTKLPKMENMVLIDDPIFQPLADFYPLFEEVMFFPTIRRVRILECQILKPFQSGPDDDQEGSTTLQMLKEAKKRREKLEKHTKKC